MYRCAERNPTDMLGGSISGCIRELRKRKRQPSNPGAYCATIKRKVTKGKKMKAKKRNKKSTTTRVTRNAKTPATRNKRKQTAAQKRGLQKGRAIAGAMREGMSKARANKLWDEGMLTPTGKLKKASSVKTKRSTKKRSSASRTTKKVAKKATKKRRARTVAGAAPKKRTAKKRAPKKKAPPIEILYDEKGRALRALATGKRVGKVPQGAQYTILSKQFVPSQPVTRERVNGESMATGSGKGICKRRSKKVVRAAAGNVAKGRKGSGRDLAAERWCRNYNNLSLSERELDLL